MGSLHGQIPGGALVKTLLTSLQASVEAFLPLVVEECGTSTRTGAAVRHVRNIMRALQQQNSSEAHLHVDHFMRSVSKSYATQKDWDLTDPQPQSTGEKTPTLRGHSNVPAVRCGDRVILMSEGRDWHALVVNYGTRADAGAPYLQLAFVYTTDFREKGNILYTEARHHLDRGEQVHRWWMTPDEFFHRNNP